MERTISVWGFRFLVPAKNLVKFFEDFTGAGTVEALVVKTEEDGKHVYARVQFTSNEYAQIILTRSRVGLERGSKLRAQMENMDIVQPRTFEIEMTGVPLNFGCQTSEEKFSVLWKSTDVTVKFRPKLKNMHFFLHHGSGEYKLQLDYENIWKIVLHNARGQSVRLLLFQLCGAPRIYKKLDDDAYSYYMQTPNHQWLRTTDFTLSCIGQSSGMCLELHDNISLPHLKSICVNYKKSEKPLVLEDGVPFCVNPDLVPIIQSPPGLELPFRILFKVCSLVQNGYLPGPKLDKEFFSKLNALVPKADVTTLESVLDELFNSKECCYDPVSWLIQHDNLKQLRHPPVRDDQVHIYKVQITPTKVYFRGPELNSSNPVLRHYCDHIDNFIRVSFVDEDYRKMYSSDLSPRGADGKVMGKTKLYKRVRSTLRNGIQIGGKKFEFLAFSSSQLQENSLWMFASDSCLTADDIRTWMGDFSSIQNVAKYATRLGQSLSSSTKALSVAQDEVETIDDVKVVKDEITYIFSDGIGKISEDLARDVARKCGFNGDFPSAFQIRYGGYKGVVAVDPTLSGKKMSLRPSMFKYKSEDTTLNVLGWSKSLPCFLNRQIITLLSTLGVEDFVFEKMQRDELDQLLHALNYPLQALEAVKLMAPGEISCILKEMLNCGYEPDKEPFLGMMLQNFVLSRMLDLRTKSRIFVQHARKMMGCLDETGTLKHGEVFVQFSSTTRQEEPNEYSKYIVKHKVAVAKNPCLHPGDLRVLEAVDVKALHHFVDCIVFPQKGERPHPNECSGSDLDGDIYFVCWHSTLIPPKQHTPMNYNPAPSIQLNRDVKIKEVQKYFINYMLNESVGFIANAHTVFADKEETKALSPSCIELATLHSVAVDYPKTGVCAQIPPNLRVREYPDFMEKTDKPTYRSNGIIGKLFRMVKHVSPNTCFRIFTREMTSSLSYYDADMVVEGFEVYIHEALKYKTIYDRKLRNLMNNHDIKTEGEILSRSMTRTSKTDGHQKSAEVIGAAVRSLRSEAKSWFDKGGKADNVYAKASAWYHVTYHRDYLGPHLGGMKRDHFISFPWCVYKNLLNIKRKNAKKS